MASSLYIYIYNWKYEERSVNTNPTVSPTQSQKGLTTFCVAVHRNGGIDKTAYDFYRYIIYECAGKKLYIFTGHVS